MYDNKRENIQKNLKCKIFYIISFFYTIILSVGK